MSNEPQDQTTPLNHYAVGGVKLDFGRGEQATCDLPAGARIIDCFTQYERGSSLITRPSDPVLAAMQASPVLVVLFDPRRSLVRRYFTRLAPGNGFETPHRLEYVGTFEPGKPGGFVLFEVMPLEELVIGTAAPSTAPPGTTTAELNAEAS